MCSSDLERPTNRPLSGWTIHKRIYELQPNNRQYTALWGTQQQWLDGGQSFFIPMGDDLPTGNYPITLRQLSDGEGYISLSQLTPGTAEAYRLFREESGYE